MSSLAPWATLAPQPVLEIKSGDRGWEVTGYASVFGVADLGNDVVHQGAFAASLGKNPRVRFLYQHDPTQIVGAPLSLAEDEKGLLGTWRISKTRLGEEVHTLLEDGALDSFSIGYRPRDFDHDAKAGTRHLRAVDLYEVSLVSMPMLPEARVTAFKADDYQTLGLEELLDTYEAHRGAALGQAKAVAARRLGEGRRLSDRALAALERLRALSEEDAAELLRLSTTPPLVPPDARPLAKASDGDEGDPAQTRTRSDSTPAPVETVGPLVEAHLRRARLNELRRAFDLGPLEDRHDGHGTGHQHVAGGDAD
jgi:Escherichia/Staphylococcus phage prohead protease